MKPLGVFLILTLGLSTAAGAATPQDFRAGIELLPEPGRPAVELSLPDAVYQGVTRADLGDLGVFNAQGTPVPYALCASPVQPEVTPTELPLQVFPLQSARIAAAAGGTHVDVESRGAVTVEVKPAAEAAPAQATEIAAYVIDARAAGAPLGALRVRWRTPDGASELHVRVEASEDLDQWITLVPQATLVQAGAAGQTLQRERIPLPAGRHAYLRLTRNDPGPAPALDQVVAELVPATTQQTPPLWIEPWPLPRGPDPGFAFDSRRLAPVETARIVLPAPNMTLQLALQSRPQTAGPWRTVWSGPVFSVGAGEAERHSENPRFGADSDRYWRIQVLQGADSLNASVPGLRLGYWAARLRFLAQGSGSFLLAYGSGRAEVAPPPSCEGLLQGLPQAELRSMIGSATVGAERVLGGDAVLAPLPKPTPLRQIVLWAVLLVGAAVVAWMALSLMRALRR